MREPDSCGLRCRHDLMRHLSRVVVRHAFRSVMQVVELAHGRIAGFQHIGVEPGSDGLQRFRVDAIDESIHHVAPRPEIIASGTRAFRPARQRALETVRVKIGHAGYDGSGGALGAEFRRPALDADNGTVVVDFDSHVTEPSVREEGARAMQAGHGRSLTTTLSTLREGAARLRPRMGRGNRIASTHYPRRMVRMIASRVLRTGSVAQAMRGHRQAALTQPEGANRDPSGALSRPSDVAARSS